MSCLKDDNVNQVVGMMQYMMNGDLNGYLQHFHFSTKTESPPATNEIDLL